jgi:hypothetical protein
MRGAREERQPSAFAAFFALLTRPFSRLRGVDPDPAERRPDETRRRAPVGRSGRAAGGNRHGADRRDQASSRSRRGGPVSFADVMRAAASGIDHVHRISIDAAPPVALRPRAVNDVARLIGELLKNAMAFSANDSPVTVAGHMLDNGGLLIEITDRGVGMGADEMARANWLLANPQAAGARQNRSASHGAGLLVVAQLAARNGSQVRLRQAPRSGVTALVWLPGELVSTSTAARPPGATRAGAGDPQHSATPAGPNEVRASADSVARAVAAARMPRFSASQGHRVPGAAPAAPPQAAGAQGAGPGAYGGGVPGAAGSFAAGRSGTGPATPPRPFTATPPAPWPRSAHGGPARPPLGGMTGAGAARGGFGGQPASPKEEARLPIFEAVRADWFRRAVPSTGAHAGSHPGGRHAAVGVRWTSPADEDWKAAQAAHDPVAGTATPAGLPKRIPRANLIPGTAAAHVPPPQLPPRSADALRSRFANYQRGGREGRHAAGELRRAPPYGLPPSAGTPPTGEDGGSAGDGSGR